VERALGPRRSRLEALTASRRKLVISDFGRRCTVQSCIGPALAVPALPELQFLDLSASEAPAFTPRRRPARARPLRATPG